MDGSSQDGGGGLQALETWLLLALWRSWLSADQKSLLAISTAAPRVAATDAVAAAGDLHVRGTNAATRNNVQHLRAQAGLSHCLLAFLTTIPRIHSRGGGGGLLETSSKSWWALRAHTHTHSLTCSVLLGPQFRNPALKATESFSVKTGHLKKTQTGIPETLLFSWNFRRTFDWGMGFRKTPRCTEGASHTGSACQAIWHEVTAWRLKRWARTFQLRARHSHSADTECTECHTPFWPSRPQCQTSSEAESKRVKVNS